MIKATVLIPLTLNDGSPVKAETVSEFHQHVFEVSPGGHTQRPGASGLWREDSGILVTDRLTEYTFALVSWRDLAAFLALVDWARLAFAQEAMYIEVMGVPEILGPTP